MDVEIADGSRNNLNLVARCLIERMATVTASASNSDFDLFSDFARFGLEFEWTNSFSDCFNS